MKTKLWITFGLITLVLAACEYPGQSTSTPEPEPAYIWIDAPLDGSSIPLEPYKIVMHGLITNLHQYEISINGIEDGFAPPLQNYPGNTNWITYGEYFWTPPAPGLYTISVKIVGASSEAPNWSGTPAQVQVIVPHSDVAEESQPILEPLTDTPTAESRVTFTPTPTATPTLELEVCTLTALVNLFCRPAPGYEPVDSFTPGQFAEVVAQSESLWQVIGPNNGARCTVPKDGTLVSVEGNCANVASFIPLPPPTETSTPIPPPTATSTLALRALPQCDDGIDNDNDGWIDLRDSDCSAAGDNDEATP